MSSIIPRGSLEEFEPWKESSTYQAILAEGEARGEARAEARGMILGKRSALIILGTERFGAPDAQAILAIEAIDYADRLDELLERCLTMNPWSALLGANWLGANCK